MRRLWHWPEAEAAMVNQPDKTIAQVLEELNRVMNTRRKP
jgi:hypothetical protein